MNPREEATSVSEQAIVIPHTFNASREAVPQDRIDRVNKAHGSFENLERALNRTPGMAT